MNRLFRIPLLCCFGLFLLTSPACAQRNLPSKGGNDQMLLGNPSAASSSTAQKDNYLIQRAQYALGYNDSWGFPTWASWHLSKQDIGDTARGEFVPDPQLPTGFKRVTTRDYSGSGYDRGHNVPSKDRSKTRQDNDIAFYMTNITPQAAGMNQGPWERLESYCRDLTSKGNELYIICGHGFTGAPSKAKDIGNDKVKVPAFGWKVIVVLPERAGDDRKRITATTRVIAVRMPNISTIRNDAWTTFRTTPGEIEKATGLKLFDALPANVATALRAKKDAENVSDAADKPRGSERPIIPKIGPGNGFNINQPHPAPNNSGKVWVNLKSGVYWRPGTQYYGKTKQGKYMTEAEAKAAGYHAPGE